MKKIFFSIVLVCFAFLTANAQMMRAEELEIGRAHV